VTLTFNGVTLETPRELNARVALVIALVVVAFFVGGQLIKLPLWVLASAASAAALGHIVVRSGMVALYTFIVVVLGLNFRIREIRGTDPIDLLAGAAVFGILVIWSARIWLIERDQAAFETPQIAVNAFLAWGMLTGLVGMVGWNNALNHWLRETSIFAPLVIVPLLYVRFIGNDVRNEQRLLKVLLLIAVLTMLWTIGKYASNVAAAAYAYQIGRSQMDASGPMAVFLACVATVMYRQRRSNAPIVVALSLLSFGMVILSGFRTLWVTLALGVVVLFLTCRSPERKPGLRLLVILGFILLAIGTTLFFTVPIFKVFVMMNVERFTSTTQVTTDASLVNRYIEWESFVRYIERSPIAGYGLGSHFQIFDWLLGYSYYTGYSHNGFIAVLAKTGIIGFLLLYGAYAAFLMRALKLSRDVGQPDRIRAIAATIFSFMLIHLVINNTLNVFGVRAQVLILGLSWGFLACHPASVSSRDSRASSPADAVTIA
jgi:O-antigen ligase